MEKIFLVEKKIGWKKLFLETTSGTRKVIAPNIRPFTFIKNLTDEAELPKPLRDRIEEVVVNSAERQIRAAIPRVLSRL